MFLVQVLDQTLFIKISKRKKQKQKKGELTFSQISFADCVIYFLSQLRKKIFFSSSYLGKNKFFPSSHGENFIF
jgi:hypothetical protein